MSLITRLGPWFEALGAREVTKKALAAQLGVSYTYLCRLTPKLKPAPANQARNHNHALAVARKEFRTELAQQVARKQLTLQEAAERAHCSERTMRRYLEKV